jgi:S-(hydroxymethyl)glutathione dehydrogenase / alcohol dehydrogenase
MGGHGENTMRAAVLRTSPGDLSIEEIGVSALAPREVLVRTVAAGLCHSDLHFIEGIYPHPTPAVMGHESAGIVEAVGDQVTYLQPGDHVITCLSMFCGQCEFCLTGKTYLCRSRDTRRPDRLSIDDGETAAQFAALGSFAEQMCVHENACVKIREDMPLDVAALIGCGVMTGIGAAWNTARVRPGDTVAVIGCGGIGLNVIQGAYVAGAGRVIAVDRLADKLELARSFGATDVVDASDGSAVGEVIELTGGGVQHAFEAIGLRATAEDAFAMLRGDGTAYVIGMVPPTERVSLPAVDFLSEKGIRGAMMGSNRFRVDMPRIIDLYLQGRIKLDELVSSRISLDQINEGFGELKSGQIARNVIVFDQ